MTRVFTLITTSYTGNKTQVSVFATIDLARKALFDNIVGAKKWGCKVNDYGHDMADVFDEQGEECYYTIEIQDMLVQE